MRTSGSAAVSLAGLALAVMASGCAINFGTMGAPPPRAPESPAWESKLAEELAVFGHRNWICVVDSAYPAQGRASIETLATGEDQLYVVRAVLDAVDAARHVKPVVYLDAELDHVADAHAPGIDAYRKGLKSLLAGRTVRTLPHEEIIAKLDEAGKTFRVLILKTDLALPYTSVFLELDCGYWGPESEKELRSAIQEAK